MHFSHQVRTLRREGLNTRSIAAALGVDQEDVTKSLADPNYVPSPEPAPGPIPNGDPDEDSD